jgi:hypothetical protein
MKSLIFMMMLSMFLVSAGVVYLSVNRDPLGGVPHVDVTLEPAPPATEAKVEAPAETTAEAPVEALSNPLFAAPAPDVTDDPAQLDPTVDIPLTEADNSEPLTTTAFPIPESDPADDAAADGAAPATVD